MKKYLLISIIIIGFTTLISFTGKCIQEPINYFNLPDSLNFNDLTYHLAWSSHPNDTYYKEESIPKNNSLDNFKDLILIDFIITDLPVKTAVGAQINVIRERKRTDAVCNYQILENKQTGEYILDFLMSRSDDHNNITLVEWDGYHYKAYTDSAGHKGVLLFGVSHRANGDDAMPFMRSLRDYRDNSLKMLNAYEIPYIQIK